MALRDKIMPLNTSFYFGTVLVAWAGPGKNSACTRRAAAGDAFQEEALSEV